MNQENKRSQDFRGIPLSFVLVVPFVLQIFATVGVVGYLSFKNGQKAVSELSMRLSSEVGDRVDQHLDNYLELPYRLAQIDVDALETGLLDIRNFQDTGRYFWKQADVYRNITFIGYYLANGEGVAAQRWPPGAGVSIVEHSLTDGKDYNYATDSQGNRTTLLDATEYYAPDEQWYRDAVQAGKPAWTNIYASEEFDGYVAASAAYPIYDTSQQLIGIFGVDYLLSDVSSFLHSLKVSPNGQVFILERNGLLIGSSSQTNVYNLVNGETQRVSALNSSDSTIQATARYLQHQFGDFNRIQRSHYLEVPINQEMQFVQVEPWQDSYGLDWLVVVTIPKSDFMEQINANTRTTILLCACALFVATGLGLLTARWITRPISNLSRASQAIADGNLDQNLHMNSIQELRMLSRSFNWMAQQIKDSFDLLENRVAQRTEQLAEAKQLAEHAKEEALVASQAKSDFLANMSHELRTPLSGILGYAQILQRSSTMSAQELRWVTTIQNCGSHLLTLINDILDLSKIEARKLDLYPTDFHFLSFLEGVADIFRLKAVEKGVQFSFIHSPNLPTGINADEKRLRQILINLLSNAIKFTDKGSVSFKVETIQLCSKAQAANEKELLNLKSPSLFTIRFCIQDTGIGMSPEQLEKIFSPFEQVGNHQHNAEGTGLGLAISQRIAQAIGSEIHVSSQLGKGSTFWLDVNLPEAVDWMQYDADRRPSQMLRCYGKQQKILVIDDNQANRDVLIEVLTTAKFKVESAADGRDGVEIMSSFRPDLLILDLAMAHMDGFEVIEVIRQSDDFKHVPILVSSAHILTSDQIESLQVTGNDFLPKPVSMDELFQKLEKYLDLEWVDEHSKSTPAENSILSQPFSHYDRNPELTSINSPSARMVVPADEIIEHLYELAKRGNLNRVIEQAEKLDTMNGEFRPFSNQLRHFAQDFQEKALLEFINQHRQ